MSRTSMPSSEMLPPVTSYRRGINCTSVDLPEPVEPMMPSIWPACVVKFTPLMTSARASGYWKLTSRKVSSPRGALAAGSLGEVGSLMLVGQVMTSSTRSAATSARGRMTETMVRIINAMTICMV